MRIRPHGTDGVHDSSKEQVGDRKLDSWTDNSVTFDVKGAKKGFNYMTKVLGPEVTQDQAHAEVSQSLLEAFLQGYNCTFLAYGQTGTGKTHTMFGSPASLKTFSEDGEINQDWGIFPRVVI